MLNRDGALICMHLTESFRGKFASHSNRVENTGILRSLLVGVAVVDLIYLISD